VFRLAPDIKTDISYSTAKGYDDHDYAPSTYFSEGLLPVYREIAGEKFFGYLDRTGKIAIPFQFANAAPFFDGLAGVVVKEKDKTFNAYINPKGEIVLRNTAGIAPFYNGLAFHFLKLWTIHQTPRERNIYGYMNKQGKYVWLSPRAETHLDKNWIKENFIGAKQN
ncbi:MAG: WG repeat-containing protein, partial [Pyrinomonadaceae bacterium]